MKPYTIVVLFVLFSTSVLAQGLPLQYAQAYAETRMQTIQHIVDSPGRTYRLPSFSLGLMIPVYSKIYYHKGDTLPPDKLGLSLHPSLSYSFMQLSYFSQQRILLNPQITAGLYYFFRHKNSISFNIRGLYNEDEFTIAYPELRYAFSLLYTRKTNTKFSYSAGMSYSYIYGAGQLFPLIGFKYATGNHSSLNILFPFQSSYRTQLSSRLKLVVYVKPQGGINRFENRLNIVDSTQQVVIFRKQSFVLGAAFSVLLRNNLSLVLDPALLVAQHITFSDSERKGGTAFIENTVSKGFQFRLMLIWRPTQNSQKNCNQKSTESNEEEPFIF